MLAGGEALARLATVEAVIHARLGPNERPLARRETQCLAVRSSCEKMVLSHLKKVGQLPPEVQADIAKRVGTYLKLASAKTDELLAALAAGAMQEQARAIGQGTSFTMDPQWAGPALAEAFWCYAKISLSNGKLDRPSTAIEGF